MGSSGDTVGRGRVEWSWTALVASVSIAWAALAIMVAVSPELDWSIGAAGARSSSALTAAADSARAELATVSIAPESADVAERAPVERAATRPQRARAGYSRTGRLPRRRGVESRVGGRGRDARGRVTGTLKVGQTLKVTTGTWDPKPTFTYQWYRGATKIVGATRASYKLVAADAGKQIKVVVTAKATNTVTTSKSSAVTKAVAK